MQSSRKFKVGDKVVPLNRIGLTDADGKEGIIERLVEEGGYDIRMTGGRMSGAWDEHELDFDKNTIVHGILKDI